MASHDDESDRQALILALARLAVERPGWKTMLHEIAVRFSGGEMFAQFVTYAGLPPMSVVDNYTFTLFESVILAVWAGKLADPDLNEFHRLAKEITK
jgi:hypothetical protein